MNRFDPSISRHPESATGSHRLGILPLLLLLAAASLLAPAGSEAQIPDDLQDPAADTIRPLALDSLEVTVLRTPVLRGDAAYAVSVLGERDLQQGNTGAFIEEALAGLPGVQIQNRYNYAVGERISIRGFGARAQFGVRGIKVLVDGIPATLPDGQSTLDHLDLGSLGRVEALRGPASALYGNSGGGVLRFQTRAPRATPFRVEATGITGSHGLWRLQTTTEGIVEDTRYLVTASLLGYDGFRTHPQEEGDVYGRGDRITLNGQVTRSLAGGLVQVTGNYLDLDAENPGSLARDALDRDRSAFGFNVAQRTGKVVRQGQGGVTWTGPLGGLRTELAAFGVHRFVRNPIPPQIIELDRWAGGGRATVHGGAGEGRSGFRWTAGAELEFQSDDRLNFANQQGEAGELTLDQQEWVRSTGSFLQGHLPLGERTLLQTGLRYDHFLFEADDRFGAGTPQDDSGDRTLNAWSPSLGVQVDAGQGVGLFANVSTSFETPTTTELANQPDGTRGFNPDLDPERGVTVEGGIRGEVADRATYELVAFRTGIENQLVPFEIPEAPGRQFFRNAGSSVQKGAEAFFRASLAPGVSTQLSWSWTDARFDDYRIGDEVLDGNRVPGLAPHRGDVTLRAARSGWFAEARWEYVDEVPVNDVNSEHADAYTLLHLRGGAESLQVGSLTVAPFFGITNLLDEFYTAAVAVNAFGGRFFEPGPGRALYVGLRTGWSAP